MSREAGILVATGKKGIGKTYTTIHKFIEPYVRPNYSTGWNGGKVLIFDVNFEFTQYKTLAYKDIGKFNKQRRIEVRRILPINEKGKTVTDTQDILEILNYILNNFRNGLLLIEDINRYLINAYESKDFVGLLCTNRHKSLDIILHYQNLAALQPRLWQNINFVRFHKQADNIEKYKSRIASLELFKIAERIVDNKFVENHRFYLLVDMDRDKLVGDFSMKDFEKAIRDLTFSNQSMLKPYITKHGKTEQGMKKAMKELVEEKRKLYLK